MTNPWLSQNSGPQINDDNWSIEKSKHCHNGTKTLFNNSRVVEKVVLT